MAVLDELATHLQTAGVGIIGTSLFKGGIPADAPLVAIQDDLVALVEIPGLPPVHVHSAVQASFENPVCQILVRGQPYGYAGARAKAQAAFVALDGLSNVDLNGIRYLWIQSLQSPFFLRTDELSRPILAFSVRCAKAIT